MSKCACLRTARSARARHGHSRRDEHEALSFDALAGHEVHGTG
jgi:hypothetical protein